MQIETGMILLYNLHQIMVIQQVQQQRYFKMAAKMFKIGQNHVSILNLNLIINAPINFWCT